MKDDWIAEARKTFKPGKRQPCLVCNRYESVTHAHHIVPLSKQFADGREVPDHAFVWLCPTHHAGVHLRLSNDPQPLDGFSVDESFVLLELAFDPETIIQQVVSHAA